MFNFVAKHERHFNTEELLATLFLRLVSSVFFLLVFTSEDTGRFADPTGLTSLSSAGGASAEPLSLLRLHFFLRPFPASSLLSVSKPRSCSASLKIGERAPSLLDNDQYKESFGTTVKIKL